jgi:CelD/BcsL family acetyltransferase involved in cellulose biosynthesis
MWKFEVCDNWEQIWDAEYQRQWIHLLDVSPNAHVFFHPALVKAWVKTYLPLRDLTPIFIRGYENDDEVFFPLVLWKKNWKNAFLHTIIPVGYSDYDYHEPIFLKKFTENQIQLFWQEIWDFLLKKYSFDEFMIDGLHQMFTPVKAELISQEPCPYIPIAQYKNIDEFKSDISSKLKKDIERRIRRIEEEGTLQYIVYDKQLIQCALDIMPRMIELHSQRWPNAYKAPNFHKNIVVECIEQEILHFSQINCNNIPISWRIGFVFRNKYYSYMPTINPDYQHFSPGKIHLLFCIEEAINHRLEIFDQLRGLELYKSEWTKQFEMIRNVRYLHSGMVCKIKMQLLQIKGIFQK